MAKMAVLVDVSRCTGCRGCQVACKQWNKNPATETCFEGTYENPKDLEWNTFTRVTFKEHDMGGKIAWLFRKLQCRHCEEPDCIANCPVEGAIVKQDNGAVVVNHDICTGNADGKCQLACNMCSYDVPRFLPEKPQKMKKCTFCVDRQAEGKAPACVTACLSGTLFYGTKDEVLAEGKKRLAALKAKYPQARLVDENDVNWIYLLTDSEDKFGLYRDPSKKQKVANV
jgi:formate dehydrogenase iron-sulfur subunit